MPRNAAFDIIAQNMGPSIDAALGRVAAAMVKEMRRRVPEKSGHLLDSIKEEHVGRQVYRITAGGEATTKDGYDYANAIEFGTHHAPAEPFFYPSVRVTMGKLRQEVAAGVKKGTGG